MKEKDYNYSRCPNCGKYFSNTDVDNKIFCSDECNNYYAACIVCGNYFSASRTENKLYCSEACSTNSGSPDHQEGLLRTHPMTPALELQEIESDN